MPSSWFATRRCPHNESTPPRRAAALNTLSAKIFFPTLSLWKKLNGLFQPEILLLESGGDNLAADFSRELADYTIYVIDVAGGDKTFFSRLSITNNELLPINKTGI